MDILGNITTLNRQNSGTSANETRGYNAANELSSRTVAGEAARYWVNDNFADNNTTGWEVADVGTGSGSWAASSGTLSCTGVETATGGPDGGTGSILLIDDVHYQDVYLSCTATLNANCDNAGLVFAYVDNQNYWVRIYSKAQRLLLTYQISNGTWTQRASSGYTVTNGTPFTMSAEMRAALPGGPTSGMPGPAGQVGVWCSDASDNSFDDFKVRDIAGPFEVDGRYFCNRGQVRTDDSNNNVLEAYASDGLEDCIVRRGFRGDKFVATFKFKWNASTSPGFLVRWLSPGDYLALAISASDSKARLYKRENDGLLNTLATSGTALSLTNNTTYEAKVVIDDDPGNSALQQLGWDGHLARQLVDTERLTGGTPIPPATTATRRR